MNIRFAALVLLGCTTLTACGTQNRSLESVHQPVVSRTDYVYDLAAPADRLSDSEDRALTGWFDSLSLRYGDRVSVDTQNYGAQSREAVSAVVARYGLLLDSSAPVTQGDIPAGSVRVIVSRMNADVPTCPDWSRPATPNYDGHSMSNYGCAINSNFAAMIADPRDLISGQNGDGVVDGRIATKAIGTYRALPTTGMNGLKSEVTRGR